MEVIILIFGQGLWFGNRMIFFNNTNKFRDFGIKIYDERTDLHRLLGIEADFNTCIPMSMVGSTCGVITLYTTYDKIETCRHITVSDENDWDPSKHIFKISSMEEEQWRNVFNLSYINQMRNQKPCAPPVTCTQDDISVRDFNRSMLNVSIGLSHDLTVDSLIGNIRVSMTKKG